ncbi:MAG TPA: MFS transporter [Caulobacteraceae bacterium]|nr:MFS transporter [Caulobacteraceae bacterium]
MSSNSVAGKPPEDRLSLRTVLTFVSAGIPQAALLGMLAVFLPRFFTHFGMSLFAIGGTLALVRTVDTLAVDLPIGWAMDKVRTPIGRYRAWFVAGAPIVMLGVYMLFNPPPHMTRLYLAGWYLLLWVGISMMVIANSAWGASLARDYNDRSRLFAWAIPVAIVGGAWLNLTPALTHNKFGPGNFNDVPIVGWIVIGLVALTTLVVAVFVREPVAPPAPRARGSLVDYWRIIANPTALRLVLGDLFLTLGPGLTAPIYLFFFNQAKGFTIGGATVLLLFYGCAGIVWAPMWARVSRAVGKHRTLQIACVCYAVFQTSLMAIQGPQFALTALFMFLVGGTASAFLFLVRAMLADYADQLRLEQGTSRVSLLFSFIGITQKLASSFNTAISFSILAWVGFNPDEHAHNTARAIFGLEMTYLFAPIVFVVIGGVAFFGYKLDAARHAEIRQALDARDAAIEQESFADALTGEPPMPPPRAAAE